MDQSYRHRGLVWPILVITAGVLLLLSNLGMLRLDFWDLLLRGWPLLLIAAGIDLLIGRRSMWGSIVAALLIMGVIVLGIGLFTGAVAGGSPPSYPVERPLDGAESAAIQLDAPVVDLNLGPGAGQGLLVEGGIRQLAGSRIDETFGVSQDVATLRLQEDFSTPYIFGRMPDWDLKLAAGVPLELDLNSGVGRAVVDLRGLQIGQVNIDLGVGQISLWLPAEGLMTVEVGMGVGQTIIRVPRGMGVRISADRGLVGLDIPAEFRSSESAYTSPGYVSADDRVEIRVSQGVGLISIRYSDEGSEGD